MAASEGAVGIATRPEALLIIYTIGHSNLPQAELIAALKLPGIERLADVRQSPASRRNPQFNRAALAAALAEDAIDYVHLPALGGRRTARPDSTNTALRDPGFRGFADYMATPEFDAALDNLTSLGADAPTAIMCAEAVPWRCHRSLIADALVARGIAVAHLVAGETRPHALSPLARLVEGRVTYPSLL